MARASAGKSVLSKHLQILDSFDIAHPFLTLSQISQRTGLPLSSVHRTVNELLEEGLVEKTPDRTYQLGIRLWEFASRTPGALGLREIARPIMEQVQSRVRQHTQLSVLSNTEVLCIERMSTRDAVVNATVIGGRIPLHASSSGLVLLAHSDEYHLEMVIKAGLQQFTPDTIDTPEELIAALRKVHADGAAICSGHIYPESRGIAVPVYDVHHHVIAALGVVVPNDKGPTQPYIELLTLASKEISKSLLAAYTPSRGATATPGGSLRPLVHSSVQSMRFLESLHKGQK